MSGVESPRHSPPPSSQAPKPKGILKNPLDRRPSQGEPLASSPPARGPPQGLSIETQGPNGLSWDEQGIALHDLEKEQTTRMKIDEPKTPFVRGSGSDDDGQFESFNLDSGSPSSSSNSYFPEPANADEAARLAANTTANASLGGGTRRPSNTTASPAVGLDSADLLSASGGATSNDSQTSGTAIPNPRTQSRSPSFSLPSSGSGSSSRRASSRSAVAGDDSRSGVRQENADAMDIDGEEAIEDENEDEETRAQREAFQRKRNQHYGNEAEALRVAKALAAQDDEEDEEGEREIPPVPSLNGVTK